MQFRSVCLSYKRRQLVKLGKLQLPRQLGKPGELQLPRQLGKPSNSSCPGNSADLVEEL
jgi:hypothetical protein